MTPMKKTLLRLMQQYSDKIEEVSDEGREDGYWLYLRPGWKRGPCDEVHSVHEWNMRDLIRSMRWIVPCDCDECQHLIERKDMTP